MEQELYRVYLNDKDVIKFGKTGFVHLLYEPEDLIVYFEFVHGKYPDSYGRDFNHRIFLSSQPHSHLNLDIPPKVIGDMTTIIVNSDMPEFAMTFLLTIDILNRKLRVKIKDLPQDGIGVITEEERTGIEIQF